MVDGDRPKRNAAPAVRPVPRSGAAAACALAALMGASGLASADPPDDAAASPSPSSIESQGPAPVGDAAHRGAARRAEDRLMELVVEYLESAFDRNSTNRLASRGAAPAADQMAAVDTGT